MSSAFQRMFNIYTTAVTHTTINKYPRMFRDIWICMAVKPGRLLSMIPLSICSQCTYRIYHNIHHARGYHPCRYHLEIGSQHQRLKLTTLTTETGQAPRGQAIAICTDAGSWPVGWGQGPTLSISAISCVIDCILGQCTVVIYTCMKCNAFQACIFCNKSRCPLQPLWGIG